MVESYYASLVYSDLTKESEVPKSYEDEYINVTAESLRRLAQELSDGATDSKRRRHQMWLATARF